MTIQQRPRSDGFLGRDVVLDDGPKDVESTIVRHSPPPSVQSRWRVALALSPVKCQSNDVEGISQTPDGLVTVHGGERSLTFAPRRVTLDDGTIVAHESQGGEMSSVWAADLGGSFFVEVAHLGDGPVGGELVMTVTSIDIDTTRRWVALGDLWADALPDHVPPSWPVAVDLALGLLDGDVGLLGISADGSPLHKDDVEALHQRLLGALHGR